MAAKVIRHPRTGKPLGPKKNRASKRVTQRGRANHSGYPDGHGPGGYSASAGRRQGFAGAEGDETVVVCEAPEKEKKKFPWGTVFATAIITGFGAIAATKIYEKFSGGGRQSNPEPEGNSSQRALLDARDYLLLAAPGAEHAIGRIPQPQPPQFINAGPSQREIDLMEREAQLRERMAEMEGFMLGQQAAAQQQQSSTLAALLDAAEDDD